MKILVYSFNDKIGDGLQKVTFIQKLKEIYPQSHLTYSTTNTTTLKDTLSPLVKFYIDEFIEYNQIKSSFFDLFKKKNKFLGKKFDLIIDLQKVVLRTLNLKKIPHARFFSTSANFLFSDINNKKKLEFKNVYIEDFYFNILNIISNKNLKVPSMHIPFHKIVNSKINSTKKKIAIAPGASSPERTWQFEKYFEIGKFLRENNYEVFFFLGPDEIKYLDVCLKNNFPCPEWNDNGEKISDNILFIMNLAKKMDYCLCNDSGTSWFFQFAGVNTMKIFGKTNSIKFARPGYCYPIQTSKFGYDNIQDFTTILYKKELKKFIKLESN